MKPSRVYKDVDYYAVLIALDLARKHGLDREALTAGLLLESKGGGLRGAVQWDAFIELCDRICLALGGYEAMTRMGEDLPVITPEVSSFAALFVSPKGLFRFLANVVDPRIWHCMRITIEDLSEREVHIVHTIPETYRDARSFFAAGIGSWKTTPSRLGLPNAEVLEQELAPHRCELVLRLPASRTIPDRLREAAVHAFASYAQVELIADAEFINQSFVARLDAEHVARERAVREWKLTARELAIVQLLVRGMPNKDIARNLACTVRTVESHLTVVMRKAQVKGRAELVSRYWREA